ncbi:hypothetical protein EZS27_018929 [termite gut metagenome]|uniref:Fibronectin type-III domain-containing protein n=1 Tax=termite gut metagenome TaxID=433724 RepID=A0A5J4RET5_9ZZZZ
MKSLNTIIFYILLLLCVYGCSEGTPEPIEKDGDAPASIIGDVSIENLSGMVRLIYPLPADPSILYVSAQYTAEDGQVKEFRASSYTNTLSLDGFNRSKDYIVELCTVGRNGKNSSLREFTVHPQDPPVMMVRESLKIKEDWGGISVTFNKNSTKANLSIGVCTIDSIGDVLS